MTNNISALIQKQVPEHLRDSSPLFTAFLETYYEYAQQRNNAVGLIQNHSENIDIDLTLDSYITKFYDTYGKYIPVEMSYDKRNFIKLLNDIYTAKGTEKAFKLLFKTLFNEEVNISTPADNILKASDGVWVKEQFITVEAQYGAILSETNTLTLTNDYGIFSINSHRKESTSATATRFYYKTLDNIKIVDNQIIFIKDSFDISTYVGVIVKSPKQLKIQTPGNNWQRGQVLTIPGSNKNTIARVVSVDGNGGILSTEILEYGHAHSDNQISVVSPYPNKPVGSVVDIVSTLVSINPTVYNHQLSINDYTDGVVENITGTSNSSEKTYFLQDYVDNTSYSGSTVISTNFVAGAVLSSQVDTNITIDEWLASRAILEFTHSNVVSTKGEYLNENGQLSNQSIRIQDNYFYQIFSYVIETTRDISEYRNVLKVVHPAGLKMFSSIAKQVQYNNIVQATRAMSYDTMYLLDIMDQIADTTAKHISKSILNDSVSTYSTPDTARKTFSKVLLSPSVVANSTSTLKHPGKNIFSPSILTISSAPNMNTSKGINTPVYANLTLLSKLLSRSILSDIGDTVTPNDTNTISKSYIKYPTSDSVSALSPDTNSRSTTTYDVNYFSSNYVSLTTQLSIGY